MSGQRLGQNFLADEEWRERIFEAMHPVAPSHAGAGVWIEVGAGHGEMTTLLARHAERVLAIELDAALLQQLRRMAEALPNVTVVAGDVLELDLEQLAGGRPFRVYGNLPYYITSPIVHWLFESATKPEMAYIMVQLEVAERLAAHPGVRDYGYLSAFTQFYARPEILLRVPSRAFHPRPQVDSALVSLRTPGLGATLGVRDERAFLHFLKGCFAQKRKTLRNNLRAMGFPLVAAGGEPGKKPEVLLESAGISEHARAEELGLEQLARLFAALPAATRA
jgi:16S rRNA (adenine1518-N6/adenine1519-N6)-dimethyltransferase